MKLVKTGIAGLDEFLTGGLPPKVLLLISLPGSGNETFARQVAFSLAKQVPVTYFTENEKSDMIKNDMIDYNWDTTPFEANGNWKFKTLTKTIDLTEAITEEMRLHRSVIVDSLSEVLLSHKFQEVNSLLENMARQNRESDQCHLLLLTEGMQDSKAEIAMQHFAEGVIEFVTSTAADTLQNDLVIKKMRGIFVPQRKLPYRISKKGFVIETATRIT
jgi:KaiC/GvpD/RAD55 family RecA-like ATPase